MQFGKTMQAPSPNPKPQQTISWEDKAQLSATREKSPSPLLFAYVSARTAFTVFPGTLIAV